MSHITLLTYIQIGISILLVITILLQQKGSGLGSSIGGGGGGMEYSTKRGAEKMIFYATIVLSVLFLGLSLVRLLL